MAELLYINLAATDVYGLNRIAQAVTPGADWDVEQIFIDNLWAGNPVTCYIMDDDSNKPGNILHTSDSQVVAGSNPGGPETFTFPTAYTLSSGVKYWFGLWSSGDAYSIRNNAPAGAGRAIAAHNGSIWSQTNDFDFAQFKVLGELTPSIYAVDANVTGAGSAAQVGAEIESTLEGIDESKVIHKIQLIKSVRDSDEIKAIIITDT